MDYFCRELGYTVGSFMRDLENHPEEIGGLMAVAEARHEQQALESGKAKLKDSDMDDPKKMAQWAAGRSRDNKNVEAGRDAALIAKFPHLMR